MKASLASGQGEGEGQTPGAGQRNGQANGQAQSDYGLETSAGRTSAGEAPNAPGNTEDRQGNVGRTEADATDYTQLYQPEDFEHGFGEDATLHGQMDLTQKPQDVQEVHSLPESQEALTDYADVVSAYSEGEEQAIEREQVPAEYQDLVRLYFLQLEKAAKGEDQGDGKDEAAKDDKPAKDNK